MWQCPRSHAIKTGMERLGCFFPEVILQSTLVLDRNSNAVSFAIWSLFCPCGLLRLSAVKALLLAQLTTGFSYTFEQTALLNCCKKLHY